MITHTHTVGHFQALRVVFNKKNIFQLVIFLVERTVNFLFLDYFSKIDIWCFWNDLVAEKALLHKNLSIRVDRDDSLCFP